MDKCARTCGFGERVCGIKHVCSNVIDLLFAWATLHMHLGGYLANVAHLCVANSAANSG